MASLSTAGTASDAKDSLARVRSEIAAACREAGLTPWSSQGTADRQAWVADLADEGLFGARGTNQFARSADWRVEADRILARLQAK